MTSRSKLRILMTTDAVGGVLVYASTLARALCAAGDDVLLVIMGPAPQAEQLAELLGIRGLEIVITDLQLEWIDPQGADLPRARDKLLSLADAFRPDLVHLNSFREASFDWPAPVLLVAHSCVWTWWRSCRGCSPDEQRWQVYARNVAAGLAAAAAWAAPTAAFRCDLTALYQPAREGVVIRNGVAAGSVAAALKQPFILAAGRLWDEAKNISALAEIAPQLPWPSRIVGPVCGPHTAAPQIANEHVACLGALPHAELLAAMRRACIFVAPARYEPFGLSVLEAAASGCALVLSDLASFRELWEDAACFVEPRDRQALCSALRWLCGNDQLRNSLQARGRSRAKLYSLAAMTTAYQELYRAILADRNAASAKSTVPKSAAATAARSTLELRT